MDERQRGIEAGKVFSPTAPIDELELFAGRDAQIRYVMDAVHQKGQHAILYGERGVGKTSLANILAAILQNTGSSKVVAPRVNCDATDTFDSVWRKIFGEIELLRLTRTMRLRDEKDYEAFKSTELLGDRITPDSIRKMLTLLSQGSLPILIIDEFDRLAEDERRPFADTIKTLSDHAVPGTVLLVGVAESVDQLVKEHQSVERALVQIRMPRMSVSEITRIIQTGLERLEMTIDAKAMQKILLLVQGLPHYAHLIGLNASRAAIDEGRLNIDSSIVDKAIKLAVDNAQESISDAWHGAIRSPRPDNLFSDVLISCALAFTDAQGTFAAQDVRTPMRVITGKPYEISSFAQHLNEFCDEKRGPVLKRMGTKRRYRYRFVNPLMQPFAVMQGMTTGKITNELLNALKPVWD